VDLRVKRPQIEFRKLSCGSGKTLAFQLMELVGCVRALHTAINTVLSPDAASTYDPNAGAGVIKDFKAGAFGEFTIDQVCIGSAIEER
jgi:hypothetical protein